MYESSRQTMRKEYTSAFLIDKPKLSKIIDKLEDKLNTLQLKFEPTYVITLSRGDELDINTLEEIFKLDNTIRNPIKSLNIEVNYIEDETLDCFNCSIYIKSSSIPYISLSVSSWNSKITRETFAVLDEQIQRTFLNDWIYRFPFAKNTIFELWFLTILLLSINPLISSILKLFNKPFYSKESLIKFMRIANNATTEEEKINFLFEITKYNIERQLHSNSSFNLSYFLNIGNFVIASIVLIVFGCIFYAVKYCYPTGVFLWGDYEAHYQKLVDTRKTLWGVVILGLAIGIIGSLFVTVLAGRINLG